LEAVSILESIKSEKRMSLKHWRYRLLHWCFNEKATCPEASKLPQFLYTHYCPLFHLTNLIAVLFPFVLVFKVFVAICTLIWSGIQKIPLDRIFSIFSPTPYEQLDEMGGVARDRKRLIACLMRFQYGPDEFDEFWSYYKSTFSYLKEDEARELYVVLYAQIEAAKEKARIRKEKMRQRLIFWTNFSRVFLKWAFNIFYILMAIGVGWLFYNFAAPCFWAVVDLVVFLCSFNPIPFLLFVAKWLLIALGAFAFFYVFWRFSFLRKGAGLLGRALVGISPPFVLLWQLFATPFVWLAHGFASVCEFVAMFYEENCPPITIISEEEAAIDAAMEEST
jgi:ABC-type multidrug transport system fused ATPase/permease subunit